MAVRRYNPSNQDELERLVDRAGLAVVLMDLAEICADKEEHVYTEWGDRPLAKKWNRASVICSSASAKVKALRIP